MKDEAREPGAALPEGSPELSEGAEGERFRLTVADGEVTDLAAADQPPSAVRFQTPSSGKIIAEADELIRHNLKAHPRALAAYAALHDDPEVLAHWDMANFITVRKLGYNDHGRVHAFIAGAASMALLGLLLEGGARPDLLEVSGGDLDDVYTVVLLGTMLHDIGNQVHREAHEEHGVHLVRPLLERILPAIYPDAYLRTKVQSFILHCVNCHDLKPRPLTFEAGVTAVADGTDITKGRGRKAFALGSLDIHSISALAVDRVTICPGREKPVRIEIDMNNSAGIFQVEEVLAPKIVHSPLAPFIELHARTRAQGDEQILSRVRLQGAQFVMDTVEGTQVAAVEGSGERR